MSEQRRTPVLATLALGVIAFVFCPGAKNGCGSKEANETLTSPVQAVTTLLERDDGTVEAELVLISTAVSPHEFVDSARDVEVRVPSGSFVPLVASSSGHYTATSKSDPSLSYVAGETYQFRFELDDEAMAKQVSGGSFMAVMDAPGDEVSSSLDTPPEFAGDTAKISWSPSSRYALITITHEDSGEVTYSTFEFTEPEFDGSKWARLKKGGSMDLAVDTFPDSGTYRIELCAVSKTSDFDKNLSAELGMLSGFLIGRCAPDIVIDVP